MKIKRTLRIPYRDVETGRYTDTHEYYINKGGYTCTKSVHDSINETILYLNSINAIATITFYLVRGYVVDYKVHVNYISMLRSFLKSIKGK